MSTKIYNMDLHAEITLNGGTNVLRVPGGWVYLTYNARHLSSVFVPFNNEFQPTTGKPVFIPFNEESQPRVTGRIGDKDEA